MGDRVQNPGNLEKKLPSLGIIRGIDKKTGLYTVSYTGKKQRIVQKNTIHELRVREGSRVNFKFPNGVDLAQKILNISDYRNVSPNLARFSLKGIKVPKVALGMVKNSFAARSENALLGLLGLLKMVKNTGGSGLISAVLPEKSTHFQTPDFSTYAMRWQCTSQQTRALEFDARLLEDFLRPTKGISILFLVLSDVNCASQEDTYSHMNLLIYTPSSKTVERFDPKGRSFHEYDPVALDARLFDLFQETDASLRYMSVANTTPLMGIQRLQEMEREGKG